MRYANLDMEYFLIDDVVYHATSARNAEQILRDGKITGPSYWGSLEIAGALAETIEDEGDEAVFFGVPLRRFEQSALEPDQQMVAEPFTFTLGATEDELYEMWEGTDQDWEDCLALYESVRYRADLPVMEADLVPL